MSTSLPFRRLLAATTAMSMVLPALPAAAQDDSAPPTRAGQIAQVSGGVSFEGSGSGGWAAAQLNYPISAGDALYTQPGGQAAIALDASRIALAGSTELQMTGLSDTDFGATQAQGEVFLTLSDLQPGESFALATPRGTVNISQDGQYDIAAGDPNTPTLVTVFSGGATVTAPGATLPVAAGQAAELSGTDVTNAQLLQPQPDAFATAQLQLADQESAQAQYQPAVLYQMTGGTELARYGDWAPDPQYGDVWYPNVDAGWAPYRDGHWANVQPWGWTWVDAEPWGFAPFHYGRWFDNGGRWGWTPADAAYDDSRDRPLYAPALVTFFGLGLAAGISIGAFSDHSIGWVPLGPGEPFRPYYRVPDSYAYRLNRFDVRDPRAIDFRAPDDFNHYRNRAAATYIGADQMRRGDPVSRDGHAAGQNTFASARPYDPRATGAASAFRLPQGEPAARLHPAEAPHPTAFAERPTPPPAAFPRQNPGFASPPRPAFGANPGYRPPPPPPDEHHFSSPFAAPPPPRQEPQVYTPNGDFNRPPPNNRLPEVYHPGTPGDQYQPLQPPHENLPRVNPPNYAPPPYQPQSQRPPEQHFSQPQPYHPPEMQQPRFNPPPMEQPHFNPPPMEQPHFTPPPPHPEPPPPPPPQHEKKPGQPY